MNNKQLYKKAVDKSIMGSKTENTAIEYYIDSGGYLDAIETDNFKDFIQSNPSSLKYVQAQNYRRLYVHRAEARIIEREENITNLADLIGRLPKYAELPRQVEQDPGSLAYVGTVPASVARDNWQTPSQYSEMAISVMGSIDLDPFTSVKANKSIRAEHFYTLTDNALTRSWRTDSGTPFNNVWMNPPYSKGASTHAVNKFIKEWGDGSFKQAIVLMNSSTDVKWYRQLWEGASGFCHTYGRIAFEDTEGKKSSGNTKGQVFFYFGVDYLRFNEVFRDIGIVDSPGGRV